MNPIIGSRSFGDDHEVVAQLGVPMALGFQSSKILPSVKHFPGHGNVKTDSHLSVPVNDTDPAILEETEWKPFREAFRNGCEALMTCHVVYSKVDDCPSTISKKIMTGLLRESMGFTGIALTDCIGTEVFLRDFDTRFATLFKGVRHDSGDPYVWGAKMIKHWENLGIDPKQKTLLFSDSLNFEKADKLYRWFTGGTNVAFGIGTYISNDTFAVPLNIVCKVVECNGSPVAKLSDDESKGICTDSNYIEYLKKSIKWRLEKTSC
jgi:hypothetical protein